MNRIFNNRSILICSILPKLVTEEVSLDEYKRARGLFITDPWERVKSIFSKDKYGNKHPELIHAIRMTELGAAVGLFFGGLCEIVPKREQFLNSNDTNIYINKKEAFRQVANRSILLFINGGLRMAPGFAIFFGGFFLTTSCLEAYRNKPRVIDSAVAGTVVGALSRFMLGVKGMISGGVVGGAMGAIYGTTLWCVSKLTNTDQIELKYAQFALSKHSKQYLDNPEIQKAVANLGSDTSSTKNLKNPLVQQRQEDDSSKG